MTEVVALAAIVAAVAIVAIFMGRPFRGKASGKGIELEAGIDPPPKSKPVPRRQKK